MRLCTLEMLKELGLYSYVYGKSSGRGCKLEENLRSGAVGIKQLVGGLACCTVCSGSGIKDEVHTHTPETERADLEM